MSQPHPMAQQTDRPPDVFGAVAEQGRDLFTASLKTMMAEGRAYIDDLTRDGAEALEGLTRCKTPFDVLMVEQHWLAARSKSWIDAGVRLLAGALHEPESAAAEMAEFRLPE